MRDLTGKQKQLIKKWVNHGRYKAEWETSYNYKINDADDLTDKQWDILVEINDTEILYQNVNNFIQDLNRI